MKPWHPAEQWESAVQTAGALLEVHGEELPPKVRRTGEALVRCERSPRRIVRAFAYLRHGFSFSHAAGHAGVLWYLWDMNHDKRRTPGSV